MFVLIVALSYFDNSYCKLLSERISNIITTATFIVIIYIVSNENVFYSCLFILHTTVSWNT